MNATQKCPVADCDSPARSGGFCQRHYDRWRRYGDPTAGRRSPVRYERAAKPRRVCSINDCGQPHRAKGWCRLHFERWQRNGDPLIVLPNPAALPGDQNCKWLGNEVGYTAAHDRVRRARGSARDYRCADCKEPAAEWSYDHLDPDELVEPGDPKQMPYSAKPEHYQPRCLPCHWRIDHPTGKPTRA